MVETFEILCSFSGIAVLAAACFFGYMLALLQRRIATMLSHDTVSNELIIAINCGPDDLNSDI